MELINSDSGEDGPSEGTWLHHRGAQQATSAVTGFLKLSGGRVAKG